MLNIPDPSRLPRGICCNTYGDSSDNFILNKAVFPVIRSCQRDRYRDFGRDLQELRAVHTIIKRDPPPGNRWLSVTAPKAELVELELKQNCRYSFHEYRWLSYWDDIAWAAFDEMIRDSVGRLYDLPELLDFWIDQYLGWEVIPDLELGEKETVCSTGCAAALMAGYKSMRNRYNYFPEIWKPFYPEKIERIYPADFGMMTRYFAQPYQIGLDFRNPYDPVIP